MTDCPYFYQHEHDEDGVHYPVCAFCSPNYCGAYSTHYRGASPTDHAFNNVGFRCAKDL